LNVGTQAQTTDIATPGPTPNQQVDAAQTNVAIAQATSESANTKYNSALQTFGANDPRTVALKNDAVAANDSLVTAQSQRDTIIATNPLLDKDPSDATGTVSATQQQEQTAYYAAVSSGDASPSDNTNNIATHVQTQQEIVDQANAVQAAQTASVASINNPVIPDSVADYRAPSPASVATNNYYSAIDAGDPYTTPNRDVEYTQQGPETTPVTRLVIEQQPGELTKIYEVNDQTGEKTKINNDIYYGDPTSAESNNYYSAIDSGDPYAPPNTSSVKPTTLPVTGDPRGTSQIPVTGTTPAPGAGGAKGGSDTPQGSAATGPSAGSC
jgi:hypothetical protein